MKRFALPLCVAVSLGTTASQAADVAVGQQLIKTHCQGCHGNDVYTEQDRRVTSLPGLYKQVRRCEQMLGLTWFDEDIDNAATYLNQEFYKFRK
jgi:mono/diheme cytochrome c family protein